MSPKTRHSLLQGRFSGVLADWAGDSGEVGTKWRYYFLPKGEEPSSLVPDVAYLSYQRMPPPGEWREKPTIAPDIVAEILAPEDRRSVLHESAETRTFAEPQIAATAAYPGLRIDTSKLFVRL